MSNTKFINGTRFLLALWVLLAHYYMAVGGLAFFEIPVLSKIILQPDTAVDGFMIITGFLMCYSYYSRESIEPFDSRSTPIKFITRRIFRLYPVYFISIVVAYILADSTYNNGLKIMDYFTGQTVLPWGTADVINNGSVYSLLSHLFFLHGFIPAHAIDILGPAWSLALEMQFYVVFPLLFFLCFRKPKFRLIPLIILAIIASLTIKYLNTEYLHFPQKTILFFKFPLFILGMVVAAVLLKKMNYKYLIIATIIIIPFQSLLSKAFIVFFLLMVFTDNLQKVNSLLYRFINFFNKMLSSKVAVFGSDISYSLYLTHMISLHLILAAFVKHSAVFGDNRNLIFALGLLTLLVFSFALSWVLYLFVEKPFILLGKKFIARFSNKGFNLVNKNSNQKVTPES
ncbi:acyltransferase family protein [Paenibacillus sp. IHBB 3054]|uniref:acyltransferase family protein n=1 Tax=Paenibacillus sp. IHBB 3054 TaxID=3425689 RepID=UPI003F663D99